jgi:hypothetical protein
MRDYCQGGGLSTTFESCGTATKNRPHECRREKAFRAGSSALPIICLHGAKGLGFEVVEISAGIISFLTEQHVPSG